MNNQSLRLRHLTQGAAIAAAYAALTYLAALANLAYGPVQFRFSEALTLPPILTSAAVPGPDRRMPAFQYLQRLRRVRHDFRHARYAAGRRCHTADQEHPFPRSSGACAAAACADQCAGGGCGNYRCRRGKTRSGIFFSFQLDFILDKFCFRRCGRACRLLSSFRPAAPRICIEKSKALKRLLLPSPGGFRRVRGES